MIDSWVELQPRGELVILFFDGPEERIPLFIEMSYSRNEDGAVSGGGVVRPPREEGHVLAVSNPRQPVRYWPLVNIRSYWIEEDGKVRPA